MVDVNKCCLTHYPAPVLAQPAQPIEEITEDIVALVDKMIDIMIEAQGVGLAGPQAGVNLNVFIVSVDGSRENARVYINPTIETEGPLEGNDEGCLSLPGIYASIKRHKKCTVTATDLEGNEFTETGEGLLGRAFQHEFDHLEGKLIKDRFNKIQAIANKRHLKYLEEKFQDEN